MKRILLHLRMGSQVFTTYVHIREEDVKWYNESDIQKEISKILLGWAQQQKKLNLTLDILFNSI